MSTCVYVEWSTCICIFFVLLPFLISLSLSSFSLFSYPCLFLLRGMITRVSLLTIVWNVYVHICLFVCVGICLFAKTPSPVRINADGVICCGVSRHMRLFAFLWI